MEIFQMISNKPALLALMLYAVAGGGVFAAPPQGTPGTGRVINSSSPTWYVTQPIKTKAFGDALFPEAGVDLAARNNDGQPIWSRHKEWADGSPIGLQSPDSAATYLYRVISSKSARNVTVGLSSDDGIEVWLNGKKIHSNSTGGMSPDRDKVVLNLLAGDNRLLVKVFNVSAGCAFQFRFIDVPVMPKGMNTEALRMGIEDLSNTYPDQYKNGAEFLKRLDALEEKPDEPAFLALQREAMLANPLMNFEKLLLIKRGVNSLGLPNNWQANCGTGRYGYDNQIAVLSPVNPQGNLTPLLKPATSEFVGDLKLDFDGDKMLFSMPGKGMIWQVWEVKADGTGLRQVTPGDEPDVDNYDPCYLPDGKILFTSSRGFAGVPCVGGGNQVANICKINADGTGIRQLCFDQDQNWCPTVLNDGSVLYTRWEYSDTPHYFTRILFRMNPDGSGQMSYYGSNSYWPNSFFYAKPVPNHPTKLVSIISGHHGVPRMGELILFDPAKGRFEADGVVQRIPGNGQEVKPTIGDGLVDGSWPKFLHPYPLSDKYFLVSCQPTQGAKWGVYLVDVFDNMTLIKEQEGYVLFEPIPLKKTTRPPVIPDRIDLKKKDATVYLADIYQGPGLKGVPRGTVKNIRLYEPHFGYNGMGGHINIGIDGPWDVHRILGTVPVEADGSASFKVPANTPIAVQPLDAEGKAVQLMRSWYTAMPGESFSCIGCHDTQNMIPPSKPTIASQRAASTIAPWYGPARGFSFKREVQPVLDKYCVGCHKEGAQPVSGRAVADFTAHKENGDRNFTKSYIALHPFVRRPGPESDYHMLKPLEYHADTSELVQMLKRGHYNVKLDAEAWDRIVTWIDLNVPDHGTWTEHVNGVRPQMQRRKEMFAKYANRTDDPEAIPEPANKESSNYIAPAPLPERKPQDLRVAGWPFDTAEASKRVTAANLPTTLKIDLADGRALDLALVPAGEFIMGDAGGASDEIPVSKVRIDQPFYMGAMEISNAQYAAFDTKHDSGVISQTGKDQGERGIPINQPNQPVVRVTWNEATEFCKWLSQKTGKKFTLPTEAQWEWACRAGTESPFFYGNRDTDFAKFANLADASLSQLDRGDAPPWHPRDRRFTDGCGVTADTGRHEPNAWGLRNMIGNAAEWTLSSYQPYPYADTDGRNNLQADVMKTVRGGSWFDRPIHTSAAARLPYRPWQAVYNVGFRVVMSAEGQPNITATGAGQPAAAVFTR